LPPFQSDFKPTKAEMAREMREARIAFLAIRPMAKYARVARTPSFTFAAINRGNSPLIPFFLPRAANAMERLLPAEFLAVLIDTDGFDDSTIRDSKR